MEKLRRSSQKRDAILEAVCSTTCHPTAEWVYSQLKPQYPGLSLGTVYRNLSEFRADGIIKSVGNINGQERFDGNTELHAHLVCSGCGAVMDADISSNLDSGISEAMKERNFSAESYSLTFFGYCHNCKSNKEEK